MAQGLNLSWDSQQSPTTTASKPNNMTKKTRTMGSRRIFPPRFKLQVLDSYRNDADCKGNQRATARKYNIHRRQIQKWLQCEPALRSAVQDAQGVNGCEKCDTDGTERRGPRIFKHDARTLKLVAQKLYPSECQLNDTSNETNATAEASDRCLIIKNDVNVAIHVGEQTIQKYQPLPSSLTPSPQPPILPMPVFYPPYISQISPSSSSVSSDSNDEPCNLVKSTEIKSQPFSPKRKWIQDSLSDNLISASALPPKQRIKQILIHATDNPSPPLAKRPCPDFSIERLCGTPKPSPTEYPMQYGSFAPLPFPPPLVLPHRTIPDLMPLHFKPELQLLNSTLPSPCSSDNDDEDDDEPIDVTSTTPVEKKSFDFPPSKRRSFSVQFKLNVLDAFHNDKECNQNQRATARKFNINRRQVQKWLSSETDLRQTTDCVVSVNCEQCYSKVNASCVPRTPPPPLSDHCAKSFKGCMPLYQNVAWSSALPVPNIHYMPWYNYTYNNAKIY